jgi:hypothetical protein
MGPARLALSLFLLGFAVPACGSGTGPNPAVTLTARHGHSMVYDEARHQLLLFGGTGTEGDLPSGDRNSTWTWDGQVWRRIATTGPSPRYLASVTYDAGRQRVVLYGGQTGVFPNITVLNDTWEWDGSGWTRRATAGPAARVHQSMAYDRARQRVVLYGGFTGTSTQLRDIWEWDGTTWTPQPASSGPDIIALAAGYDEKAGALSLIGIIAGTSTVVVDAWNGVALTRTAAAGPGCVPPPAQLVSLGPVRGGLFFYSGTCGGTPTTQGTRPETWRWDGASWLKLAGSQPDFRTNAAMAYDRDRDRVVLFGGEVTQGVPDFADTWEFDGTAWIKR